jgi:hypothetical protein
MSGHPQTKRACESVEDSEMLQDGTQPEFEMGAPPKKKPCGAVEDKTLPLEFELDEDDEYELKREQARLEAMEDMLKLKDNEKIEEKIEESEPSQPATKKKRCEAVEHDFDEEYELKARLETARLEAIEDKLKIEKKAEDNEKIEETIEESEPSQPAKKKGIQTVGVESQSAMELEKVLKKVKKASEGSQDNMSAMMTGP